MNSNYQKRNSYSFGKQTIMKSFLAFFIAFGMIYSNHSIAQDCTVNAGLPQTICPSDPFTLTGVVTGNLSATPNPQWTLVSGPGGTINNPSSMSTTVSGYLADATKNTTLVYRLSVTCLDGVRTHQDVTETIKRLPTIATVGADTTLCSIGTFGPLQGSAISGAEVGAWSVYPASGLTIANPASPTSNYTVTQPGIYSLTWTVTTSGPGQQCFHNATMKVTESGPAAISAGSNRTISCSGNSITLSGSNPGLSPQIGNWTLISGPNTPTFSNVNAANSTLSNLVPGTYILKWNVNGPCSSGSATVTINVSNINFTQSVGSIGTKYFCNGSGETETLLVGTTPDPGVTVAWTPNGSPATGTTIDSPNSSNTVVRGLDGSSSKTYSYKYTLTAPGGCVSSGTAKVEFVDAVTLVPPANVHILLPCGQTATTFTINRNSPSNLSGSNIIMTATSNFGHGGATFAGSSGNVDTWNVSTCTPDTINSIRFTYTTPCSSTYVDVTFETSAGASGTNAGTDQILPCTIMSTNLAGNSVSNPEYGTWYEVSGPNDATLANSNLYNTGLSGLTYGDYYFRWVISNGSTCLQNQDTVMIEVPTIGVGAINAGVDTMICNGMSYTMNSTGALPGQQIRWDVYPSTGVVFTPSNTVENPTVSGMAPNSLYTYVKTVFSPCDSAKDTMIITSCFVKGPPPANAGADQCLSAGTTTVTLSGNLVAPFSGVWYGIGSASGSITSASSATTTVTGMTPGIDTFVWMLNGASCGNTYDTTVVTIAAPATTANAGIDQYLCSTNTATLAANAPTVGVGTWSQIGGANGVTITSPNINNTTVTGLAKGSYFFAWTIANGTCTSNSDTMVITVSSSPTVTANAGSTQNICTSYTTMAANAPGSGNIGQWSVISVPENTAAPVFSNITSPTSSVSGMSTGTYVFQWAISTIGSCAPSTATVTVNVYAPALINIPSTYCNVNSINLLGTTNTNGTWSVTSQPSGSPTVVFTSLMPSLSYNSMASSLDTGAYTFRYDVPASGSCAASFATKSIYISYPVSPAIAGTDINVCVGATSTTLNATTPVFGIGAWSVTSGPNSPTFGTQYSSSTTISNLVPGVYVLTWSVANGSCPTATDKMQINVEKPATAGAKQSLCGANNVIVTGNAPVLGQGTWSKISGPASDSIISPNSPISNIIRMTTGTYIYQWSTSLAGCAPNVATDTIVIYQNPTTANAGPNQSHVGSSVRLAANNPTVGTGSWSVYAGPNVPTFSSISSASTTITGLIPGTYILEWTITNGICSSSSLVTIISDAPTADTIITSKICNTSTSQLYPITSISGNDSNTGGKIFSYTVDSIPTPAQGLLYYFNGSNYQACNAGIVLTPSEANKLEFAPANGYSGTVTFQYHSTNNFGFNSNEGLYTIPVSAAPTTSFTSDSTSEYLATNNFKFITTGSSGSLISYNWSFGDGSSSLVQNPVHTYTAAGIYSVTETTTEIGSTCTSSSTTIVYVLSNSVTTGNGGGLESESLGGLVSWLDFTHFKNSIDKHMDYAKMPVLTVNSNTTSRTTGYSGSSLIHFVPTSLNAATVPYITTPADILTITSAVDVYSIDYVSNNQANAVVLAITTLNKAYNHTKSICDRFKGATLINTTPVTIQGYNFIQFALLQPNGVVEYCIAFDAGKSKGSTSFDLQSKWLITQYKGDDSVFNFQAWAADPANTTILVNKILNNLAAVMPLKQIDSNFQVPAAYIASGKRNQGNLNITVTNNSESSNGKLGFEEMKNEFANPDSLIVPMSLNLNSPTSTTLNINDGYQYQGGLFLNGVLVDEVYMADGNWSLDYDHSITHIDVYQPTNEANRVYVNGEYPVYRGVSVKANSSDYISAYKFIAPGDEAVDLTAYQTLKFFAQGSGKVVVRLLKDSIVNWNDQYTTAITLDTAAAGKNYQISFNDFASSTHAYNLNPKDIKAVVFTFSFNGVNTDFNFYAGQLAFSNVPVVSGRILEMKNLTVSPNPNNGIFNCQFESDNDRQMEVKVSDLTGKVVYTQNVHGVKGLNNVQVTLPKSVIHPSELIVTIGYGDVQYTPVKISVQ